MITQEVVQALESARAYLESRRDADDPTGFLYRVSRPVAGDPLQSPRWYSDLLRISDGGRLGAFQYRSHDELTQRDNYLDMSPGALGDLDPSSYIQIGVYVDVPVVMRREDGSIWSFPDFSGYWWMDRVIEQVAPGLDEYLRVWVFNRSKAIEHGELGWQEIIDEMGLELPQASAGGEG